MAERIGTIIATRVSGDLYTLTSPHDSLAEQGSWRYLCSLSHTLGASKVVVHNNYASDGELPTITYDLHDGRRLEDMVRPSRATTAVVDYIAP